LKIEIAGPATDTIQGNIVGVKSNLKLYVSFHIIISHHDAIDDRRDYTPHIVNYPFCSLRANEK